MKTRGLILSLVVAVLTPGAIHAQSTTKPNPETATTKLGSITGRILSDGQAVPNASITVNRISDTTTAVRYVPTNDNGEFEAKGLDAGIYRLSVAAPGYVSALTGSEQEMYYRVGDSATLTLRKGGVITGRVLGADDEPVVAVRVRAIRIRDENGKSAITGEVNPDRLTDDRGIYRVFGLRPGVYVVSAGGSGSIGFDVNGFDHDAPIYAPSSPRDTAAEISIASGEEKTVDIHYRSEAGHALSGRVSAPTSPNAPWISIYLARLINGTADVRMSASQNSSGKGFEFLGLADGDYLLWAQYSAAAGETLVSDARRITIKGADIAGIELVAKPLATVAGEFVLVPSNAESCQEKRRPSFPEMVVGLRRNPRTSTKDVLEAPSYGGGQATADNSGKFIARNLRPGQYDVYVQFFSRHWYLQSIARPETSRSKEIQMNDLARTGLMLKSGEAVSGLRVTLVEGGATFSGKVQTRESQPLPPRLNVYIVPSDKDKSDDVMRYFSNRADADGSFAFEQIPPGHYWAIVKIATDDEEHKSVRSPDAAEFRAKLRREAELDKAEFELTPCQNLTGHKLLVK